MFRFFKLFANSFWIFKNLLKCFILISLLKKVHLCCKRLLEIENSRNVEKSHPEMSINKFGDLFSSKLSREHSIINSVFLVLTNNCQGLTSWTTFNRKKQNIFVGLCHFLDLKSMEYVIHKKLRWNTSVLSQIFFSIPLLFVWHLNCLILIHLINNS